MLAAVLGLVAWGRLPDLWVAGPAAVLVVVTGLVGIDEVGDTIDRLAPTLAFLAAVFVLAEVARDAGLFTAAGAWMGARASSSRRLVLAVSAVAIVVTVLMSLDATAVLFTPVVARTVRSAVLAERDLDYVTSSKLRGESSPFVMFREILPNTSGPIVVELTVRVGYAVFTVATLSFLGAGPQPPSPDWGTQVSEAFRSISAGIWWTTVFPAAAIASLVIAANLIADSVQSVLEAS